MIAPHIAQWALKRNTSDHAHVVVATQLTTVTKPKKAKKHTDEVVLETKGGGGYVPPPQPSPMEVAAANDWTAQQEFNRNKILQDQKDEDARIKKEADDQAWTGRKNTAYEGAKSAGRTRLDTMGLSAGDPYGVNAAYTSRIDRNNAGLQTGDDFTSAFSDSILDEILGTQRTGQRTKLNTSFNTALPQYYAEDRFSSSSDDSILQSILDSQYNDALQDFEAARNRGQVSSTAYDRALKEAGNAKNMGWADLQKIGGGVLSDVTGDINTRRQSALDQAANWDYGSTYDPNQEAQRIRGYADERGSTLDADIRAAVGDKNYFDVNSLLGKAVAKTGGGSIGGGGTTGTSALYDTFENEAKRNTADTRQNEGTF